MYAHLIFFIFFGCCTTAVSAQRTGCANTPDSAAVLQLLTEKGLLYQDENLTEDQQRIPVYRPKMHYNPATGVWTVCSAKYSTTRKGKCRHTNGCTIVTSQTVVVDAQKMKILHKRITVKSIPNYE